MRPKHLLMAGLMAVTLFGAAGVATAADERMIERHEVSNDATWRKAFDRFAPTHNKLRVMGKAVYPPVDGPNDVTVMHDFRSLEKAKAFAASAELKAAMDKAGEKGPPTVWYATRSAK